jgi:hypothetical protein
MILPYDSILAIEETINDSEGLPPHPKYGLFDPYSTFRLFVPQEIREE